MEALRALTIVAEVDVGEDGVGGGVVVTPCDVDVVGGDGGLGDGGTHLCLTVCFRVLFGEEKELGRNFPN